MDIKTLLQDEKKKKFLIFGLVAFFIIIGIIFFLTKTPSAPQDDNSQLLSDLAKLAPRNGVLDTNRATAPIVTVSSDATIVAPGQQAVISWSSPNAVSCIDDSGNEVQTKGSLSVSPTSKYTLGIVCTNTNGTTQESLTIDVTTKPIITLSAYPSSVKSGAQSFISWNTTGATRCVDSSGKALRLSDRFSVSPKTAYTFSMSCTGPNGESKNSITVAIAAASTKAGTITEARTTISTAGTITSARTITVAGTTISTAGTITEAGTTISTDKGTITKKETAISTDGKSSINVSASATHVKYGESSTISLRTKNAKNCTITTDTGVEMDNPKTGKTLILQPYYPPVPLSSANLDIPIRVLDGKSEARLTLRCDATDGTVLESTIVITGDLKTTNDCIGKGRPKITSFEAVPKQVGGGGNSFVSWNTTCASSCNITIVPWGETITSLSNKELADKAAYDPAWTKDKDYNTYRCTSGLPNIGVNANGSVRVYPGSPFPAISDSCPVPNSLADPNCTQANNCTPPPIPSNTTVTIACVNGNDPAAPDAHDTITVSVIPPGASCRTLICDIVDFFGGLGDALGGLLDW